VRRLLAGGLAALAVATTASAAQPQFWRIEGARDFLQGESKGLSIDSEGRVRLAPTTKQLFSPETPYVWALARDGKGVLYAGTGNDGKVFRIQGEAGTLFYDAPELEVHALAVGPDGRVYVGTSPEGKVWAVDKDGKAEVFFDPTEKYVWALAFDKQGRLLVATGGDGRIYRVDKDGKAVALLTSPQTHITALATDDAGHVFAGSAPEAILYRIDPAGKVFVLNDAPYREVKALAVSENGSLYAALVDGKEKEDRAAPPPPPAVLQVPPTADVTVTESFTVAPGVAATPPPIAVPRPSGPAVVGAVKGALLRVAPSGEVDTVWSSSEETPHALLATAEGVLLGTGDKGHVYRIKDDRTWSMVATVPAEQVTALRGDSGGAVVLGTSNPARVHVLEPALGTSGTFVSKVQDTDTVSSWGRIRWQAAAPEGTRVVLYSRSGNTGTPDSTWSDWSSAYTHSEGDPVSSERARFLQVKAALEGVRGSTPVLDSVTTAFLQRNLRPQVQAVTVHPPGEVFQKPLSLTGEVEILGLDTPVAPESRPGGAGGPRMPQIAATSYSRRLYQKGIQTLSWRADDPNQDTLSYDVYYRPLGDTRHRLLRKGLTDAVLAWDTSTVPNGRYVVRIVASDAPSNPEQLALAADKESEPFDVDNTPPTVTATLSQASPLRVRATVRDDNSLVRRTEYAIDGGRWEEVHPVDGINDAQEESYEIAPKQVAPGPHVIVVRATDLLGNVSTARVEAP
jgi:sugar lactone lactonase YvrE